MSDQIKLSQEQVLGLGFYETSRVSRVQASIKHNDHTHERLFALKIFDKVPDDRKDLLLSKIVADHAELKRRGFRTLPTLRLIEGGGVYMTDLTRGGKHTVLSYTDLAAGGLDTRYSVNNTEQLLADLKRNFINSVKRGVYLTNQDIFFLDIDDETKNSELILADLRKVLFLPENYRDNDPSSACYKDLVFQNYSIIADFIVTLNKNITPQISQEEFKAVLKTL